MSSLNSLVQCDFDGTVTEEDVSFFLLDSFAQGDWRKLLRDYKEHRMSVGEFNTKAFAMVKADKSTLLRALRGNVRVRPGFHEFADYCRTRGFRLVIVSNGLEFYIRAILDSLRLSNIEVHAAQASFDPRGMKVRYVGPAGAVLEDGFKEAYTKSFVSSGYRVIYIGNGDSDIVPAKFAHHVFATGDLLSYCRQNDIQCKPFEDFIDIVTELRLM